MSDPLAYHITWTTYGSWLHGDERGWVKDGCPGIQAGDDKIRREAASKMSDKAVVLSDALRLIVDSTIRRHCEIRGWELHALNVRTMHVHVVVAASVHPDVVMAQLKAWCSRRLSEVTGEKRKWWTEHGSTKWINDNHYLQEAVEYVRDRQ